MRCPPHDAGEERYGGGCVAKRGHVKSRNDTFLTHSSVKRTDWGVHGYLQIFPFSRRRIVGGEAGEERQSKPPRLCSKRVRLLIGAAKSMGG